MAINVITLFEIEIGGPLQKRSLSKEFLTALSIWLVEGISIPDVSPLTFHEHPFIWRVNPETGDGYFKVSGCDTGMNFLEARELLDDIESLAGRDLLMEDTYPAWYDHPSEHQSGNPGRYKVMSSKGLLGFIDCDLGKHILPIALKLDDKDNVYRLVMGEKEKEPSPYYKFG